MDVTSAEIELQIDELVLAGADPSARQAIVEALQAQLSTLFSQQPPSLTESVAVDRMDAGALRVSMHAEPQSLGAAIATSVHSGFSE
jgi:hypothetical protein